jgi:hypothetical protein
MNRIQAVAGAVFLALALPAIAGKDKGGPTFSGEERRKIEAWFAKHPEERARLPPGLAKKGKVPPGWQKKLAKGKPVPKDLWEMRQELPKEILVKLPAPPEGVRVVRILDRVVKVREDTRELLDELNL